MKIAFSDDNNSFEDFTSWALEDALTYPIILFCSAKSKIALE